ncbi:MAG: hypothetical protein JWR66_3978, partial [Modestobacter sp.]|nr:hypothetical protein [Modestobacter sp.]
ALAKAGHRGDNGAVLGREARVQQAGY